MRQPIMNTATLMLLSFIACNSVRTTVAGIKKFSSLTETSIIIIGYFGLRFGYQIMLYPYIDPVLIKGIDLTKYCYSKLGIGSSFKSGCSSLWYNIRNNTLGTILGTGALLYNYKIWNESIAVINEPLAIAREKLMARPFLDKTYSPETYTELLKAYDLRRMQYTVYLPLMHVGSIISSTVLAGLTFLIIEKDKNYLFPLVLGCSLAINKYIMANLNRPQFLTSAELKARLDEANVGLLQKSAQTQAQSSQVPSDDPNRVYKPDCWRQSAKVIEVGDDENSVNEDREI